MKHPPKMSLRYKLVLWFVLITVASTLLAESIAWGLLYPTFLESRTDVQMGTIGLLAGLIGGGLGLLVSSALNRRLRRMIDVGHAWLRGNLSARIADPIADDLGLLAEQLDLLADHLEQDEQDLNELRTRDIRQIDQVRTLAVTEERSRLARELHDSIKQYLFSLAMTAGGLRTRFDGLLSNPQSAHTALPQLAETVHELETTAQTAQREITRLIRDLKPGTLEEQGLGVALNDYALLFGAREHIMAYVDVQGNDAIVPPSVAEALYRVAQEALHNVARHARATRVDLRLRCLPEQVTLTVNDNGVGFDPQQMSRRGLGIANMEERMMAVGGQVVVEGRPGRGTTVTARVALTQPTGTRPETTMYEQERPRPSIENWGWLGQKLVIPVGQTWPWLPADQIHLRQPLIETDGEMLIVRERRYGLGKQFDLLLAAQRIPLLRIRRIRTGYAWHIDSAVWTLRYIARSRDQMVLMRNDQPLAALQAQGRLMNAWSELIYDDRGYRLVCDKGGDYVLIDQEGNETWRARMGNRLQIELKRPIPLPLLAMVTARIVDDTLWMSNAQAGRVTVKV